MMFKFTYLTTCQFGQETTNINKHQQTSTNINKHNYLIYTFRLKGYFFTKKDQCAFNPSRELRREVESDNFSRKSSRDKLHLSERLVHRYLYGDPWWSWRWKWDGHHLLHIGHIRSKNIYPFGTTIKDKHSEFLVFPIPGCHHLYKSSEKSGAGPLLGIDVSIVIAVHLIEDRLRGFRGEQRLEVADGQLEVVERHLELQWGHKNPQNAQQKKEEKRKDMKKWKKSKIIQKITQKINKSGNEW